MPTLTTRLKIAPIVFWALFMQIALPVALTITWALGLIGKGNNQPIWTVWVVLTIGLAGATWGTWAFLDWSKKLA